MDVLNKFLQAEINSKEYYESIINFINLYEIRKGEFEGNDAYIPRSGYDKDEVFVYNKELTAKLSELWVKVKAH